MAPEFEDDKIIRWQIKPGEEAAQWRDPSVLEIDLQTEEVFEGRTYTLGRGSSRELLRAAREHGIPAAAARVFREGMSFRFLAKRAKADGLITYQLTFKGLGEAHLLLREENVSEDHYRHSVAEFEADVLPTQLVQAPQVISRGEWRRYEEDMREPKPPVATP